MGHAGEQTVQAMYGRVTPEMQERRVRTLVARWEQSLASHRRDAAPENLGRPGQHRESERNDEDGRKVRPGIREWGERGVRGAFAKQAELDHGGGQAEQHLQEIRGGDTTAVRTAGIHQRMVRCAPNGRGASPGE